MLGKNHLKKYQTVTHFYVRCLLGQNSNGRRLLGQNSNGRPLRRVLLWTGPIVSAPHTPRQRNAMRSLSLTALSESRLAGMVALKNRLCGVGGAPRRRLFFPLLCWFFLFFFPDACADCETHHLRIPTPAPIRRPVAVPRSCSLSVYMGHCCCKQRKMPSQQEHLCHTKKGGGQEIDGVALSHRLRQSHILSGA